MWKVGMEEEEAGRGGGIEEWGRERGEREGAAGVLSLPAAWRVGRHTDTARI